MTAQPPQPQPPEWQPPRVGILTPRPWLTSRIVDGDLEARVARAIEFREGDRVPIWDLIDNRPVYDYFAPDEPDYLAASVKVYHGLGIDLLRGYTNPFRPEQEGQYTALPADADGDRMILGSTSWRVNRRIRSVEELRSFPTPPPTTREEVWEGYIGQMRRCCEAFAPRSMYVPSMRVGFVEVMTFMLCLELASYAAHDAPDDLRRVMDAYTAKWVVTAECLAEAKLSPLVFVAEDIAYKGTLMYSPAYLRREFLPRVRQVIAPLKRAGLTVIYHSDGNIMGVLDDLIEAGVDGINPIEPGAGMDIGYLKRRYRGRLILVGNVDTTEVALRSPSEAAELAKENIRAASAGGGHLVGSSTEILPLTPLDNILTFYQALHEYGKYPIRIEVSEAARRPPAGRRKEAIRRYPIG